MINENDLKKIDSEQMYLIYNEWPKMAIKAFNKNYEKYESEGIDHIVFAGMGGSGTLGDIFEAILSKTKIYVTVVKGYLLPKTVGKNTLVICTSISGNTIETLTVLKSAKKSDCRLLVFTAGGQMEKYCRKEKIEFRKIEETHSPRASFPTFLYSMLNVLESILPLKKEEIYESLNYLEEMQAKISYNNLTDSNEALNLAEWITNIPVIYYPWGLQAATIRYKNSLQENSKIHVIIEDVIEARHNEIVAWEEQDNLKPIIIQGADDYIKTKERWNILKKYFEERNIEFKEIHSVEGNILSKIINLIYLLDFSTIYLSIILKINPSPVESINYIKSKIKN